MTTATATKDKAAKTTQQPDEVKSLLEQKKALQEQIKTAKEAKRAEKEAKFTKEEKAIRTTKKWANKAYAAARKGDWIEASKLFKQGQKEMDAARDSFTT